MMAPLSHLLPSLPGFTAPQTYAPWPVWSDSTTKPIRFVPMPKKAAVRLWHRACSGHMGRSPPPPMPSVLAQAVQEGREGSDLRSVSDPRCRPQG